MRSILFYKEIIFCCVAFLFSCESYKQKEHFSNWQSIIMSDGWSFHIPQNVIIRDIPSEDGEMKEAIFPDSVRITFGSFTSEKKAGCFADSLAKESLNYCNSICQGSSITSIAQCFPYFDSEFGICGTIMEMSDIEAITSFHATIRKSQTNKVLNISFSPHSRVKRSFIDSVLSQINYGL